MYLISFISTSYIILDCDLSIQFEINITKVKVKLMIKFNFQRLMTNFTVKTKQSTKTIFSLDLVA